MCTDDGGGDRGTDYIVPAPDPFPGHFSAYQEALNALRSLSPNAENYASMTAPLNDIELDARLIEAYNAIYQDYHAAKEAYDLARDQYNYFLKELPGLDQKMETARTRLETARAAPEQIKADTQALRDEIARLQERTAEITPVALDLVNGHKDENAIISYLIVFSHGHSLNAGWLDHEQHTTLPGLPLARPQETPWVPPALAAPWAEELWPTAGHNDPILTLRSDTTIDDKIATLKTLAADYSYALSETARFKPDADTMKAEFETKREELSTINREASALEDEAEKLDWDKKQAEQLRDVEKQEAELTAREVAYHLAVDYAESKLADQVKDGLKKILGADGLLDDVPFSKEEAIEKMARAGKMFFIPIDQHPENWESFMAVQKRSLTLVERTEGFIHEAARVMAEGSPEEIQNHLDRIFSHLRWESVEYIKDAGLAQMDEEDRSTFGGFFDSYIGLRKQKDGVE